jgi:hypothetical protein
LDRVVGTIAYRGGETTVSGSNRFAAMEDLRIAVDSALTHGQGECFWHEAMVDYRWLFRREGDIMRFVIIRSAGTLTGWEHCFWAECELEEFREAMLAGIEGFAVHELQH